MTVAELIKELEKLPKSYLVVQSKDAEGNNFSPLSEISTAKYYPQNSWSAEISTEMIAKHDAVVLWPTN